MNITFETIVCAWDEKNPCTPFPNNFNHIKEKGV